MTPFDIFFGILAITFVVTGCASVCGIHLITFCSLPSNDIKLLHL